MENILRYELNKIRYELNKINYGFDNRLIVTIEELAELQKELTKLLRADANHDLSHIAEEVADVEIMIEELKYHLQIDKSVGKWKDHKIQRQINRGLRC